MTGMSRTTLGVFLALAHLCVGQEDFVTQKWIQSDAAQVSATETQSLLNQICPGQGYRSGCDVCPEGTAGVAPGSWELRAIFLGHFLSPMDRTLAVTPRTSYSLRK